MLTAKPDATPGGAKYLKTKVRLITRTYAVLGAAAIAWVHFGMPTGWLQIKTVPAPSVIVTVLTTVLSVVVVAIESLPGPNGKAALIFWRRRDPLPGSRAFEKASLDRDTRIDRDRLLQVVGGKFPRGAQDQNSTWYRLYKSLSNDTTVQAMHYEYLLFRDLAWLSVVLGALALANLVVWPATSATLAILALGFAILYLLFRTAARERGYRFVNQVLVTVSAAPVKLPKK